MIESRYLISVDTCNGRTHMAGPARFDTEAYDPELEARRLADAAKALNGRPGDTFGVRLWQVRAAGPEKAWDRLIAEIPILAEFDRPDLRAAERARKALASIRPSTSEETNR